MMKQVVARNKHYEIGMDPGKNRAYITIIGFWRSPEEVGPYVQDLDRALVQLAPGFTLLTDLTQMKAYPASVQPLHLEAQQLLLTRGLSQTAEVCASSMVEYQTNTLSKKAVCPSASLPTRGRQKPSSMHCPRRVADRKQGPDDTREAKPMVRKKGVVRRLPPALRVLARFIHPIKPCATEPKRPGRA